MQATIILSNARVYNISKVDVRLAESFRIELHNIPDFEQKLDWYSNEDSVLEIVADKTRLIANIKATGVGTSIIEIQHKGIILRLLEITVYQDEAIKLNPIVSTPVLK